MALDTYTNLKAAVADWLNKSNLTSQIPDFITIAEKNLGRKLTVPAMYGRATLAFTVDDAFEDLPANTVAVLYATTDEGTDKPLLYRTPGQIVEEFPLSDKGRPVAYTVVGKEDSNLFEMQLGPTPDAAYTLNLYLRKKIPVLVSGTNETNYWTDNTPDLLLYETLIAAEPFLKRDARIQTWMGLRNDALADEIKFNRAFMNTQQQDGVPPSGTMVA